MFQSRYLLGARDFRTKAKITDHVRAVRDSTPLGAPITDTAVLALLTLHPEWEEKTTGGGWLGTAMIQHPSQAKASKQIAVLFTGTDVVIDISWTCIVRMLRPGNPPRLSLVSDVLSEFRRAARYEIHSQIMPLRRVGYAVDHVYPKTFEQLLFDWVTANGLRVPDIKVGYAPEPQTHRFFADKALAASWQAYHAEQAVLEVIPVKEHNARTRRSTINWSPLL